MNTNVPPPSNAFRYGLTSPASVGVRTSPLSQLSSPQGGDSSSSSDRNKSQDDVDDDVVAKKADKGAKKAEKGMARFDKEEKAYDIRKATILYLKSLSN